MLTESEVIDLLCRHLQKKGYSITQRLTPVQKGHDVIAIKKDLSLYIEAKGGTSSRKNSARSGQEFSPAQILNRVGKAIVAALATLDEQPAGKHTKVGIAYPDCRAYSRIMSKVYFPLHKLGIIFFSVSEKKITVIGSSKTDTL